MANAPDRHARAMLPIPDRPAPGLTTYDAKDPATAYPPIEPLLPPEGAPNVLIVLLDDVGFGASSAFGGPCATPVAERLAAGGLKYNRFHTTALCAPTRQAMLTGRNHHSVGMGSITETATSAPGNSSLRPNTKAPLAMTLKLNGYSTAQFGKCHEVPVWQSSPMGPFDAWPSGGGGFETFYGFIGGENNQWDPALYDGTTPVEPPATPEQGYHLTEDLADRAVAWVRQQKALMPERPFFVYFAPGATHAPHHVPTEWADKYAGQFADGWDAERERTFAKQQQMGVIPADAELTTRHAEIPAWDDMPAELKPVLEREMEVYAGFLEHTDYHVGRVIDAIDDLGVLDNTIIYYIIGDNGASAEGTLNGAFNEMANFNGMAALETPEFMLSKMAELGSPSSYNHYAVGWSWAMNTPFQWTKQIASHWGGTRNGAIVHWPAGIDEQGGLRTQFTHVIDVAPTVLEAAGLPEPTVVNGVQQSPMEGTSMLYTFREPETPERHDLQYFEMFANRGIYHQGWSAVTKHRTPWVMVGGDLPAFDDDVWELYDGSTDYSQARNLAAQHPDVLARLQRLFLIEATKYNVLPMDDRTAERLEPTMAGRPTLIHGNTQLFYPGMGRLSENSVVSIKNKSFSVTAEVEVPEGGANGVIMAQGGRFGGWAVYAKDGKLKFVYNVLGIHEFATAADAPMPSGTHQVRVEFAYDGGGLAKGGDVTLYYDGNAVGTGRVEATQAMIFSADETTDIGYESGTTVTPDYSAASSRFTGKIQWVQLDVGDDDHDHFIDPDERFRIAMARQQPMAETTSTNAGAAKAVLITLAAAQFVMILDSSVMNVSIATVAKDLDTTVVGIQTAITLYTLVMASLMITGGKMGAILGRKRAFTIGCVIYACGSLTTALAPNLPVLLFGWSFLEGVGAALVMPAIVALVASNFGAADRPKAYGLVTAGGAIAVAVGPLIGGLFTTYWSWRYVFVGEVLIIGVVLLLNRRTADTPREEGARLDLVGTGLSALGLGLIVYGILRSGTWGFVTPKPEAPTWLGLSPVVWLILAGGGVLYTFLAWERRRRDTGQAALLDPAILRVPLLRSGVTAFFFQYLLQAGLFFAVPLFLSIALGLSAIDTGLRILPLSITLVIAAVGIPKLFPHASPRLVSRLGFLVLFVALVVFVAALDAGAGPEIVTWPMLLAGLGIGALASQLGAVTVSSVSDEQSGEVGGLQNTASNLGISIGTALAGAILISALSSSFFTGIASNPAVPEDLTSKAQTELTSGVPFISDADLETALDDAGVPAEASQAIVDENADARLDALRASLSVLAVLALVALFFGRGLPTTAAADQEKSAAAS